jgi:L-iditol 2-dehydrogenase
MKTQSACLTGINQIEVRERELKIGPEEVLVRTRLAGICGSDKNLYQGIIPPGGGLSTELRKPFSYPYFLGHEGGGEIVEVGNKIRDLSVGDTVMAFGWVETFSEYFKAREEDLEAVPEGLDIDVACLGEPIACALFSGLQSEAQLGDVVAVVGMGFAGQIIAQVVKAKGAFKTIGVDVSNAKLKLAQKLGVDHVTNAEREDPLTAILGLTGGAGADVMVEAAGTEEAVNLCSQAVKHNGTIVYYSWITQDITINISRWHHNSLKIINTGLVHHGVKQRSIWVPQALRPITQGQIAVKPLITHRFPFHDIQEAFAVATGEPSAIKVVLDFHPY